MQLQHHSLSLLLVLHLQTNQREKEEHLNKGCLTTTIDPIGGMMNVLNGATLFFRFTHAPNIFMICVHRDSLGRFVLIFSFNTNLGAHMGHLRFVVLFGRNNQHENT